MKPFYITKLCLTCHIYFALAITSHLDKDGYPLFPISTEKHSMHWSLSPSKKSRRCLPLLCLPFIYWAIHSILLPVGMWIIRTEATLSVTPKLNGNHTAATSHSVCM